MIPEKVCERNYISKLQGAILLLLKILFSRKSLYIPNKTKCFYNEMYSTYISWSVFPRSVMNL
jgi:hypothetical protein